MVEPVVRLKGVAKKFRRAPSAKLRGGLLDGLRRLLGRPALETLREGEFWALQDIDLDALPGECIGIIGPNGAGKSTLLRLIAGDLLPDRGRVHRRGRVTSLTRLGQGLRPLMTGRENILMRGQEMGLSQPAVAALMAPIQAFSGLSDAILERPVRTYSDGMYARLEFAIATSVPLDVLLVDEVLAVGDMAFQIKCLERLHALKAEGTTLFFVSHQEMNVRHVADRCLLLQEGRVLGLGDPEPLFRGYYAASGFLDRRLEPLSLTPPEPPPTALDLDLVWRDDPSAERLIVRGEPLVLALRIRPWVASPGLTFVLQFWSGTGLLIASFSAPMPLAAQSPSETLRIHLEALGLPAGTYRVAGGLYQDGEWLTYRPDWLKLHVRDDAVGIPCGLFKLTGRLEPL